MTKTDVDVLVVGAGPSGLTAAVTLARLGVKIRIVDKKPKPLEHSYALVVHPRTLELLDLYGLADELVARGYPAPGLELGSDPETPMRMEFFDLDTRYPYILVLPQSEIEEVLETHLGELAVKVERSTAFESYADEGDAVVATVVGEDGTGENIQCRYLLGTDGAGSTVRSAAGLKLEGERYKEVFINAEVKVDRGLVTGGVSQYFSDLGAAFLVPFRDGYFRIATLNMKHQDADVGDELTLEHLQETLDQIVPTKPRLMEPRWLTYWRTGIAQVHTYRKGNVFLAGDAAHIHSPAGGQGMNTGIGDAVNLGWKLGFVINGTSPPSILESFQQERHPVGTRAIKMSDNIVKLFLNRNYAQRKALERVMGTLISGGPIQQRVGSMVSGLAVSYKDQAREDGTLRADLRSGIADGALAAGDRMPDADLFAPEGDWRNQVVRLYDVLRHPCFTLIFVARTQRVEGTKRAELVTLARQVEDRVGNAVKSVAVFEQGLPMVDHGLPMYIDGKQEFKRRTGVRDGSVLLVRPDGYIGFHRGNYDSGLAALIDKWILRTGIQPTEMKSRDN